VTVPEDEDVDVWEETVASLLTALGRATVMDDREAQAGEFDTRHFG
jgi:hypothetical protein